MNGHVCQVRPVTSAKDADTPDIDAGGPDHHGPYTRRVKSEMRRRTAGHGTGGRGLRSCFCRGGAGVDVARRRLRCRGDRLTRRDRCAGDQLRELNIAVDDVPRMLPIDPGSVQWPAEGVPRTVSVPLARLIPPPSTRRQPGRAQIVVFRRPLRSAAPTAPTSLTWCAKFLIEQVATYLGLDEDTVRTARRDRSGVRRLRRENCASDDAALEGNAVRARTNRPKCRSAHRCATRIRGTRR